MLQRVLGTTYHPENTHLFGKGKYHFTADLLFDWFELSSFAHVELDTD